MDEALLKSILEGTTYLKCLLSAVCLYYFFHSFLKDTIRPTAAGVRRKALELALPAAYFAGSAVLFYLPHQPGNVLGSLTEMIIISLVAFFIYEKNTALKAFLVITFYAVKGLCFFIAYSIYYPCYQKLADVLAAKSLNNLQGLLDKSFTQSIWLGSIFSGFLFVMFFFGLLFASISVINRSFVHKSHVFHIKELLFLTTPSLLSGLLTILLLQVVIVSDKPYTELIYDKYPLFSVIIPAIGVLSLFGIISSIVLFQKIIQLNSESAVRIIAEQQFAALQEHTHATESLYSAVRSMKHDLRGHIMNMKTLLAKGYLAEAEEYFDNIHTTINQLDFHFQTGHPVTDAVINEKYQAAKKLGIDFKSSFSFPNTGGIEIFDLSIILNNVLENALEGCETLLQKENASPVFIHLTSYQKKNLFFIEVKNSFSGNLVLDNLSGLPLSTKKDSKFHGIGLHNVKETAKKYFGALDILPEKQVFTLTVMLKTKS